MGAADFFVQIEERGFCDVECDERRGVERSDLTTKFRSDGARGAGDEDFFLVDAGRDGGGVEVEGFAAKEGLESGLGIAGHFLFYGKARMGLR